MAFRIIRNDITKVRADAIVNTACPYVNVGSGVDTAIYEAAGYEQLLKERAKIGDRERGSAAITPAFNLDAKYIIHTVGPKWIDGTFNEEETLRNCYANSLKLAYEHNCKSITFPLISTGNYGFPKDLGIRIASDEINSFLLNVDEDVDIILTVFDETTTRISERLFKDIESFIDNETADRIGTINYSEEVFDLIDINLSEQIDEPKYEPSTIERSHIQREERLFSALPEMDYLPSKQHMKSRQPSPKENGMPEYEKNMTLDEVLSNAESESFLEMLERLTKERGMKNSELYTKANLTKGHFSKIKNKKIHPSKDAVISLAIGLELNMDQTVDFLQRAGYTFIPGNKRDLIICYFIKHKKYTLMEIEFALDDYDLPTLQKIS